MWRIVRLLKKHGVVWADQREKQGVKQHLEERGWDKIYKREHFELVVEAETVTKLMYESDGTLKVPRKALANMYFYKYCKDYNISDFTSALDVSKRKEARYKWKNGNAIIDLCIKREKPYIEKDERDSRLIFLTPEGESFADIIGLLKGWVEAFGLLKSTAVVGIAGLFLGLFFKILIWIYNFGCQFIPLC